MAFDGRKNIIEIDEEGKTVYFETWKPRKITGAKIGPILGCSDIVSEFKVACEIAGIYPGDGPNKFIDAGNALEPVIRGYVGASATKLLAGPLGAPAGARMSVELPVPKEKCQYDHFHGNRMFGGMVDGYVLEDGRRAAVLEIKTSGDRAKWLDADGRAAAVPQAYLLQAGLYAELAGLDKIVFAVGFLEPADYDRPESWTPSEANVSIIAVDRPDMAPPMKKAEEWYAEYILNGCTPEWTDRDADLVKYLRAGVKWRGLAHPPLRPETMLYPEADSQPEADEWDSWTRSARR